jgi:hypothetical protein
VWPLHEPLLLLPLREYDLLRFKLGLPHSSVGALRRPSAPHAEAFSPPPAAPPEDAVAAGISPFEAAPVPSRHRRRMTTMAVSEAATTRPMPAETPPPTR